MNPQAASGERKIKILIGKPGLDGHDQGAKVVVRALLDAGFDVVYTGLRQTPQSVVDKALRENADVIGLSSMAGNHLEFCRQLAPLLKEHGLQDKLWIIGGNIPADHAEALKEIGLDGVFPTGSPLEAFTRFIHERAKQQP